jgi:hypothetical protein
VTAFVTARLRRVCRPDQGIGPVSARLMDAPPGEMHNALHHSSGDDHENGHAISRQRASEDLLELRASPRGSSRNDRRRRRPTVLPPDSDELNHGSICRADAAGRLTDIRSDSPSRSLDRSVPDESSRESGLGSSRCVPEPERRPFCAILTVRYRLPRARLPRHGSLRKTKWPQ